MSANTQSDQRASAAYARVKHENVHLRLENERLRAVLQRIAENRPLDLTAQEMAERALDAGPAFDDQEGRS